jgi:hypothetical protein
MLYNKLISEFLTDGNPTLKSGDEYDLWSVSEMNDVFKDSESDDSDTKHFFHPAEMKFGSSWDWLMPVVNKCTQIGFRDEDDEEISSKWDELFCDNPGQFVGVHIDEVYRSVVQFITWYNSLKTASI